MEENSFSLMERHEERGQRLSYKIDNSEMAAVGLDGEEGDIALDVPSIAQHPMRFRIRHAMAKTMEPRRRVYVAGADSSSKLPRCVRRWREHIIDWIEPGLDRSYIAAARAIVNESVLPTMTEEVGEVVVGGEERPAEPTHPVGEQVFMISNRKTRTKKNSADKLYRIAGVLCNMVKTKLGPFLPDTPQNRALVMETARRRLEALRKKGEKEFMNLREIDAVQIASQAAILYWIADDGMITLYNLTTNHDIRSAVRERNHMARVIAPPAPQH